MEHIDAESIIATLAEDASLAKGDLAAALTAFCPGGNSHRFTQHRDGRHPWCDHCRYTEWAEKVPA